MSFSDIVVQGYRLNGIRWGAVAITGGPALPQTMNALELRDHGLGGGEIHIELAPENIPPDDLGFWYAAQCHVRGGSGDVIGTIHLKRMNSEDICVDDRRLLLEELDQGHLLNRLSSEVLAWHAQDLGPGPFARTPKPRR